MPAPRRLAENIDAKGILEVGSLVGQMLLKFPTDRFVKFRRQLMVAMRNANDPFFKLRKVVKVAGG